MGRPYSQEMKEMRRTYEWARTSAIGDLAGFVKKRAGRPLYAVGSGGSFTAATLASALHRQGGAVSDCMTPLEFVLGPGLDRRASVMLITAGGNNKDILAAFQTAAGSETCIVCASTGNRLIRAASEARNATIHAARPPSGRDGFLATNSLASTMVWLARAYSEALSFPYEVPRFDRLGSYDEPEGLSRTKTVSVVYDYWGKAAAVDMESKLVEAGLANVQTSDYRNFAHGRHNWLDKAGDKTCVVALVTPNSCRLADRTLGLLPRSTPVVRLSSSFDGPAAAIDLTLQAFKLVGLFGRARDIDPGRPGIKDFGRKLYGLGFQRGADYALGPLESLALQRKFGSAGGPAAAARSRQASLRRFLDRLSRPRFGAVVFDYDGTLCDDERRFCGPSKKTGSLLSKLAGSGVVVGVATGRGDSARESLAALLPKRHHEHVLVGYHNCAEIGNLADSGVPDPSLPADERLHAAFELIKSKVRPQEVSATARQISIRSADLRARDFADLAQELGVGGDVRAVESSHSVDLLAPGVSKLALYDLIRGRLPTGLEILCVGDRGRWPGNDHELLATPYSLSVDDVSEDPTRCWNLLSRDTRGEAGVSEYLGMFDVRDGFIRARRPALHKNMSR